MFASLRVRLLLLVVIVLLLTVGTVAALVGHSTQSEFRRFLALQAERDRRLVELWDTFARQNQSPAAALAIVQQMSQDFGERTILVDNRRYVLADSEQRLAGPLPPWEQLGSTIVLGIDGPPRFPAGTMPTGDVIGPTQLALNREPCGPVAQGVSIVPLVEQVPIRLPVAFVCGNNLIADPMQASFIRGVNRSLLIAGALAGSVGLLLVFALGRRIIGPITALTAAAHKLADGDLRQRVSVQSKDEVGELARAFNVMADGLARLEQLRHNMVSDVAHELRTPLANIRGYLEAVRDGVIAPEPALIESLHEEALLLNHLVDDLQELQLAEAGQLRLDKQPLNIGECISKAVLAAQPAVAAKGLVITTQLPADLPLVSADSNRIGQVLRNLIQNAITHTSTGGHISATACLTIDQVEVSVVDSGSGISAEHLAHIFDRFYRADNARARATGGAGLGLAIVKQLVQAHKGRVEVASSVGEGTTFRFSLPLDDVHQKRQG